MADGFENMFNKQVSNDTSGIDQSIIDQFKEFERISRANQKTLEYISKQTSEYFSKYQKTFEDIFYKGNEKYYKGIQKGFLNLDKAYRESQADKNIDQEKLTEQYEKLTKELINKTNKTEKILKNNSKSFDQYVNGNDQTKKLLKELANNRAKTVANPEVKFGSEGEKMLRRAFYESQTEAQKKFEKSRRSQEKKLLRDKVDKGKAAIEGRKKNSWLFNFEDKLSGAVSNLTKKVGNTVKGKAASLTKSGINKIGQSDFMQGLKEKMPTLGKLGSFVTEGATNAADIFEQEASLGNEEIDVTKMEKEDELKAQIESADNASRAYNRIQGSEDTFAEHNEQLTDLHVDLLNIMKEQGKTEKEREEILQRQLDASEAFLNKQQELNDIQDELVSSGWAKEASLKRNAEKENTRAQGQFIEDNDLVEQMSKGLAAPLFDMTQAYKEGNSELVTELMDKLTDDKLINKFGRNDFQNQYEQEGFKQQRVMNSDKIEYPSINPEFDHQQYDFSDLTPQKQPTQKLLQESIPGMDQRDWNVVPGNNTSGDNVPALLNSGEMVLNTDQQAKLFKMLEAPEFADGGIVGLESIKNQKQAEEAIESQNAVAQNAISQDNMVTNTTVVNSQKIAQAKTAEANLEAQNTNMLSSLFNKFSAQKQAADKKDAMSLGGKILGKTYNAAMGAWGALSPIPFVGPVLGGAAFAGIMAAGSGLAGTAAGLFEQGGVVPGENFEGDKMIARVNSGEMILNTDQQQNLFNAINNAEQFAAGGIAGVPSGGDPNQMQNQIMDVANKEEKKSATSTEALQTVAKMAQETVKEVKNVAQAVRDSKVTLVTRMPGKQFPSIQHRLTYAGY